MQDNLQTVLAHIVCEEQDGEIKAGLSEEYKGLVNSKKIRLEVEIPKTTQMLI